MAYDMRWLNQMGSLEKGIDLVNKLYWCISVSRVGDRWFVNSGDQPIFSADSREVIDGFLYGLALAYSVFPGEVFENLRKDVERYVS